AGDAEVVDAAVAVAGGHVGVATGDGGGPGRGRRGGADVGRRLLRRLRAGVPRRAGVDDVAARPRGRRRGRGASGDPAGGRRAGPARRVQRRVRVARAVRRVRGRRRARPAAGRLRLGRADVGVGSRRAGVLGEPRRRRAGRVVGGRRVGLPGRVVRRAGGHG